jgi:hypothetical protein
VTLTISEQNTGNVDLTNVWVDLYDGANHETLGNTTPGFSGDANSDGKLNVGETWQWILTKTVSATTTFTATGHGTDSLNNDVTYPEYSNEQAQVIVQIAGCPNTKVTITASPWFKVNTCPSPCNTGDKELQPQCLPSPCKPNGNVTLTIREQNTGKVDLTNVWVDLYDGANHETLGNTASGFSGDANSDGKLNVGETWQWILTKTVSATTTFTATGHGTDPLNNDVTYPKYSDEQAKVIVVIVQIPGAGPCNGGDKGQQGNTCPSPCKPNGNVTLTKPPHGGLIGPGHCSE